MRRGLGVTLPDSRRDFKVLIKINGRAGLGTNPQLATTPLEARGLLFHWLDPAS